MTVARPILMSAPMVCASIAGLKKQTRRALKHQPLDILPMPKDKRGREWVTLEQREPEPKGGIVRCRYGLPGDLLWVRETHAIVGNIDPGWVLYRASGYENECRRHGFDRPYLPESEITWRPSIHMHRWASRLTLRITDVRVERLQSISEADAIAEGLLEWSDPPRVTSKHYGIGIADVWEIDPRRAYRRLWESINGDGSWDANPWVWVIAFATLKQNVDAVTRAAA